ncbi:MAG: TolC family protein [Candidatus Eremiobacteraeota bacterium]|nr:TolC family protein [Candidatus Eremiobacteraeota bacterium]
MRSTAIITGAIAVAMALPAGTFAQKPVSLPTPIPRPTGTPSAYPAYGTPAPGVATLRPIPGVPQQITLQQAIDIAAAKSPVLAAARGNYLITQIPVLLSRGALFPNISATATETHSTSGSRSTNTGGTGNGATGGGSFTSRGLNANLRQLIFDGGRILAQLHAAQASAVAGLTTYQRNAQTLAFNVATAYYNTLQAHQATLIAVQVVQQNQVQENLVRAQIATGTAARADLATAELPTAQARVALVRAQGAELSAIAAFANTIGLDADAYVIPVDDTSNVAESTLISPPLTYDTAVQRALSLRPDYVAAQSTVRAAEYNLRAQRLGLFPTLNGDASAGTNSTLPNGTGFVGSSSIGLTLNIPIFDQGITHAQSAQAQYQLDIANAQLENERLGVEVNVRQALVNLVSSQAALQESDAELSKALQVLQSTQAQYRAGVTTLPLLLNAQVGLTQAQTDRLNALYTLRQAQQAYRFALGESDLTAIPT